MTAFVAGVVAGYGVAVPVGAVAVLIIGLTARTSLRVGAAAALGVATADGLYALLAVVGGGALAGLIAPVATPMRWLAVVVLIGIAARTTASALRHRRGPDSASPAGPGLATSVRAYGGLLGLTLLNPMTIVYFGALVLGRQAADGLTVPGEVLFVLGAFLASVSWQLLIAVGGALVGRALSGPRGRLVTALASSLLIVALAVNLSRTP
ncbi:LysE family transporter [Planosporangium mesophilum]|uniref:Lysine transporter LysE n=1 Tax=Planosporangium mesophilum TaxID=689768 RepID=A0A8J3TBP2_9ACTN|nr:LysE family transporter [Planosporangium mesophilum]GII23723.1 lysine transporter LysE [Planosporangium mesophilum]